MEGEVPPPPFPNTIPNFFTPSLPASISLHPSDPSNSLLHQLQPIQNSHLDIDWVSLLSGSITNGDQNPLSPSVSSLTSRNIGGENGGRTKGKAGRTKKAIPPRIAFHTRSAEDILDDGYRWRKYGQKSVKNSIHPRSYYRCTHHTCNVKKQIQRLSKDTSIVVTTYEGIHNHPCEKLMETLSPLLKQLQFLSRF
ncbi:hypothetical protein F0562_013185 [Nyssa sinensis]|uniref:WRKY domain-containing protein n=1 Tax=Nyssa sinensis TaxID=561372 RepID=A0A5J4ZX26_9ASTE|nr:hypothetical protein F0562_013185 [Nyssa sinensis]